jgi:hypothetical protein
MATPTMYLYWQKLFIFVVEDEGHLLERASTGFGKKEINDDKVENQECNKGEVILPANASESDRVDKHIENTSKDTRDPHDTETSGSKSVRPDLKRVRDDKRRPDFDQLCFGSEENPKATYKAMS